MDHGPESLIRTSLSCWIAYERDAVWTAKLAILRATRADDIRHFGACLDEHNRHAEELTALARVADRSVDVPKDASFLTQDPFIVGAIDSGGDLVGAMERVEAQRIDRYLSRPPATPEQPATMLNGLLDRHLADARERVSRLRELRERRRDRAA
jgi:hypothetical protein